MLLASLIVGALVIGIAWATRNTKEDALSQYTNHYLAKFASLSDVFGIGKIIAIVRAVKDGSILYYMDRFWTMYGDTYTMKFMGTKVTFTRDASNMKHIFTTGWLDYHVAKGIRDNILQHLAPGTIAVTEGEKWEVSRKRWRQSFLHLEQLFDMPFFEESSEKLARRIPRGEAVDMQELFFCLTADLTSNFTVGRSLHCLDPENQSSEDREFMAALARANPVTAMRGILGPLSRLNPEFGYKADCNIVTSHIRRLIRERLSENQRQESNQKNPDTRQQTFLDRLVIHYDDPLRLNHDATVMMMSNEELSRPLSHSLFLLSRHPAVYTKLRQTILDQIGYEKPTYEDLGKFTYLKCVIHETLRLLPPIPLSMRIANKNTWLPKGGGKDGDDPLLIPKGQRVVLSIFGSHHSPSHFGQDASEFRPERWNDLRIDTPGYSPFLLGSRSCLGRQLVFSSITYPLVRLVQMYSRVESRDDADFAAHIEMSLSNMNGVWVEMFPDLHAQNTDDLR
ncbi:unnamed protein product [Periconia digitata]|uniref:Cytochrome P450 n=1 Tax=Periconia digitata TaxID=1303443 RepID=A0A9W4UDG3_9PLEO|nr:unnamed protein product [Periconia digitata]